MNKPRISDIPVYLEAVCLLHLNGYKAQRTIAYYFLILNAIFTMKPYLSAIRYF